MIMFKRKWIISKNYKKSSTIREYRENHSTIRTRGLSVAALSCSAMGRDKEISLVMDRPILDHLKTLRCDLPDQECESELTSNCDSLQPSEVMPIKYTYAKFNNF